MWLARPGSRHRACGPAACARATALLNMDVLMEIGAADYGWELCLCHPYCLLAVDSLDLSLRHVRILFAKAPHADLSCG